MWLILKSLERLHSEAWNGCAFCWMICSQNSGCYVQCGHSLVSFLICFRPTVETLRLFKLNCAFSSVLFCFASFIKLSFCCEWLCICNSHKFPMGFLFIIIRYAPSSAVPPLCFNVYISDANVGIPEHLELLLLAWFIHLCGLTFSLYSWRLRVFPNDWKGGVSFPF